jgi:hypothetical protein
LPRPRPPIQVVLVTAGLGVLIGSVTFTGSSGGGGQTSGNHSRQADGTAGEELCGTLRVPCLRWRAWSCWSSDPNRGCSGPF